MKTLILVTSNFPFGTGESFLSSEFPLLLQSFKRIIIIAQNISDERTGNVPGDVTIYRYNTSTSLKDFLHLPLLIFINSATIFRLYREETAFRKSSGYKLNIKKHFILLKRIIKAIQMRDFICNTLLSEGVNESLIFYSYWLKTGAHAISLLRYKNSIKISRAHGSDIYEEKTQDGYLPLLRFAALNLDAIFFISENGKEYIKNKTKTDSHNFILSYLGVNNPYSFSNFYNDSCKFCIVSCSNLVPLKRIDLIIRSLEIVKTEKDIEWIHFGEGFLRTELSKLAERRLSHRGRIRFRFPGYIPNEELFKFYNNNRVNLFINTSLTEGIPVSIMEAQSFGIPVIATDTGGVSEIITTGTGSLLPVNFNPEDLAVLIEYYVSLSEKESESIRLNAIKNWNSKFNALSNYKDFIIKVNSILVSCKD